MKQSKRMQAVQSPIIPVVGHLIRENPGTISLGQGVVNYGPPESAIDSIREFLSDANNHKYQMVEGIPELREQIEAKLTEENRIRLDAERALVVTAGGNMAFLNAVLAVTDPGDEVIQLVPYYFNHEMAVTIADCRPVCVETDDRFQPDLERVERAITPRTRAVVTISPNNPTGAVYSPAALQAVNELCARRGIYHIHDEAYEYFLYGGAEHYSPASDPAGAAHTISLYSMSKAYGFASWRIGWMVLPGALLDAVRKIQDTNLICPPVISQWAAAGALRTGSAYCRERIAALATVRGMVMEKLSGLGDAVTVAPAAGALYLLLGLHTDTPDMEVVRRLITRHRVAVIPGSAFGISSGCFLRVAFGALEPHTVSAGVDRLVEGLREL